MMERCTMKAKDDLFIFLFWLTVLLVVVLDSRYGTFGHRIAGPGFRPRGIVGVEGSSTVQVPLHN
jgi:hypothetical protein